MDFVLWKPSTGDLPGWEGPWSYGRPGWHIECSAMSKALLGDTFDIHGGGIDLQFPHHENEVAQSCCANHTPLMAQVWMHNGFLQVEGEKMAKSLGNFFTVKDLLEKGIPGEVIRFVLLSTHYRSPLDWTEKRVDEALTILTKWYRQVGEALDNGEVHPEVVHCLSDDLNTPGVITELHQLSLANDTPTLRASLRVLGFLDHGIPEWAKPQGFSDPEMGRIQRYLAERTTARKNKDFVRADAIRDGLAAAGVEVRDRPGGEPEIVRLPHFDATRLEAL